MATPTVAARVDTADMAVTVVAAVEPTAFAAPGRFEHELTRLVNDYRRQHGLPPLAPSEPLSTLAVEHSLTMAARREFSHAGFRDRFERAASALCVENLARNFATPEAVLAGWRNSPSHDRNLLESDVTRVGFGVAARHVTFFACR